MKLTEAEEERQYLLLVTAAAVRARLKDPDMIDYTLDRLQRVVTQAEKSGQSEIATIARGELDVAKRVKEERATQSHDERKVGTNCDIHGWTIAPKCYDCYAADLCKNCGKRRDVHQAVGVFNDEHYCPTDSGGDDRFSKTQWFTKA